MKENGLIRAMVYFKIRDVSNWTANGYNTHIKNISKCKGNQAIKFGQLTKHKARNIFVKKSCGK